MRASSITRPRERISDWHATLPSPNTVHFCATTKCGSCFATGPAGTISHGLPLLPPNPTRRSFCFPRTSATTTNDFDPSGFVVTSEIDVAFCTSSRKPACAHRPPSPTSLELGARNTSSVIGASNSSLPPFTYETSAPDARSKRTSVPPALKPIDVAVDVSSTFPSAFTSPRFAAS